jgi:ADP-heptose:LPS heptosyltransferase
MHTVERQRDQLEAAGITRFPAPDLGWLAKGGPAVSRPYALLAPGSAPHRPEKRWPAARFGELARLLQRRGIRPVVVGTDADRPLAATIGGHCAETLDLTGRTSLLDLGGLAARAALAVGNDTGPMHLAAVIGCPCVVLFSGASDPALTAPRGLVTVLRERNLADLAVERVAASLP